MADARLKPPASKGSGAAGGNGETSLNYSTHPGDPHLDGDKWPAWKVTMFVVGFCGAFWTGLAYLLVSLLS